MGKAYLSIRRNANDPETLLSILGMNGYSVYAIPDPEDYSKRLIIVDLYKHKEEDVNEDNN